MKRELSRWPRVTTVVAAVVGLGAGIAGTAVVLGSDAGDPPPEPPGALTGAEGISLVNYDSCDTALRELKDAAKPHVTAYGFGSERVVAESGADGEASADARSSAPASATESKQGAEPGHSTTNTHESDVDEPDLVKTDGDRVVSIVDGRLRVVDVASREQTAELAIPGGHPTQLLLDGDRALVMTSDQTIGIPETTGPRPDVEDPGAAGYGAQLVLVDLSGGAEVAGTLAVDGHYVDARQTGSVVRVVLRSGPDLDFVTPSHSLTSVLARVRNKAVVENSSIEDWLPRYRLSEPGDTGTESGQLTDCAAVSHPADYTGQSMLTVLTIDLRDKLGVGDPVSIVADGDTVYGTASSLYVADDHVARVVAEGGTSRVGPGRKPPRQRTEIYQFDISGAGKPVYVASGSAPGTLLNQYSLSEYDGNLRVATTVSEPGECCDRVPDSESMVTVLTRQDDELVRLGKVDGLGRGERIYAVRFFGDVGYVVTFRETDPLYTVDLSDPAEPRVTGELKITGYSAYLHSVGDGKLLGVGQEATTGGQRTGTQVSLFDISAAKANRTDQVHLAGSSSEVESDPHAFLYWPDERLIVVPVSSYGSSAESGALVLRVDGSELVKVGMVRHGGDKERSVPTDVRRAMVIGEELWTVSDAGIRVSDLTELTKLAWVPFD